MKKIIFGLALICAQGLAFGQSLKTTVAKKGTTDPITHLKGDSFDNDAYEIVIYLSTSKEELEKINKFNIKETISINGKKAKVDMWIRYEDADAINGNPSYKVEIDLEELLIENAHLLNEKDNELKFDFNNERADNAFLGTASLKVDVPGYNDFNSKFCNELYTLKSKDEKVDKTLQTIFKAVYPHTEILDVVMQSEWNISPEMGDSNSYMIFFKNKGQIWMLKYSASYVVEDGVLIDMPRVKIYNGLDDPNPVSESCYKAMKVALK